jgi:hypothetical protein
MNVVPTRTRLMFSFPQAATIDNKKIPSNENRSFSEFLNSLLAYPKPSIQTGWSRYNW